MFIVTWWILSYVIVTWWILSYVIVTWWILYISAAVRCPNGAAWLQCASACPRTCEKPRDVNCSEPCRPGCECTRGTVLHNNKCVRPSKCQNRFGLNEIGLNKIKTKRKGKRRKSMKTFSSPLDFLIENK